MAPEVIVLLVSVVIFAAIGIPIAWSLVLSSALSITVAGTWHTLPVLAQQLYAGGLKYALLAVFFFVLSGGIMQHGGLSKRLIDFAKAVVGHVRGGMSLVCMVACTFFAAISGSAPATTAAIGGILYPELKQDYPESYAAALPAAGGILGTVIPPSILFILYGSVTDVSPGRLLMSGIIPGALGSIALCVLCYIIARRRNFPKGKPFCMSTAWDTFRKAIWALLMPLIILGGIYSGIFTPTEAAAVSCAYGLLVSMLVYKELSIKTLIKTLKSSAHITANIMMMVMSAGAFSWLLTVYLVPGILSNFLVSNVASGMAFMLGTLLLLTLLGMIMDTGAIILILGPMLAPVALAFGIDPILYGLLFVFTISIGKATPPFGICLFVASSISKLGVIEIGVKAFPFV